MVEEFAVSCHKSCFSIWQINLACASCIPCLCLICGAQKMSVFDFRVPLVGTGLCLADFSLPCVHQKAGLGCLNIFIFNVELKRLMTVFESSEETQIALTNILNLSIFCHL